MNQDLYHEELNQIAAAINDLNEAINEDEGGDDTELCSSTVDVLVEMLTGFKETYIDNKPDLRESTKRFTDDVECAAFSILGTCGQFWRNLSIDSDPFGNLVDFAEAVQGDAVSIIDSIADAKAALQRDTREIREAIEAKKEAPTAPEGTNQGLTAPEADQGAARIRDREQYTTAFMHGVKCLAEDLAARGDVNVRDCLSDILKENYDYTDDGLEILFH